MKNIFYIALMMLSSVAMVTSCGDDDDGSPVSANPAAEMAGTYTGTWTVVADSPTGETSTTYDGTLVLTQTSRFAMTLTTSIPSLAAEASKSAPVNVVATTSGYYFSCTSDDYTNVNPYGKNISGRIEGNNVIFTYTGEIKIGRAKYGASYSFSGHK